MLSGTQDALERVEFLEQDEVTERVTEDEEVRHGLPLPRAPKVPSLDELSNDLDVPSELPASAPSALIQPRVLFSAHEDKSHAISGETSLETIRRLVDTRRVETALQQLSQHSYGVEGSLLRLRCLIQLRRFDDAAEECKSPELQDTAEAQLFLAQAPWRVHSDAYQAMLKLKALAEAWHETGAEPLTFSGTNCLE
ncbi:unnamed protein product [Durusdinium trenchii]|uniref:Uncharacterized protein n=1 Tax=Durusdinium trenchii TaxID=1381693 RepID=A0ABP0RYJ5_9DINO